MSARSHGNGLFEHRPERLVINGYRCAMAGYEHGDPTCWDQLWNDLLGECGLETTCDISGALQHYVRTLRAHCPRGLQFFPRSCNRACADECLVLSLLSACQNSDAPSRRYCLNALSPGEDGADISAAAELFSGKLKLHGLQLMPVPENVIAAIMDRTCRACPIAAACRH